MLKDRETTRKQGWQYGQVQGSLILMCRQLPIGGFWNEEIGKKGETEQKLIEKMSQEQFERKDRRGRGTVSIETVRLESKGRKSLEIVFKAAP